MNREIKCNFCEKEIGNECNCPYEFFCPDCSREDQKSNEGKEHNKEQDAELTNEEKVNFCKRLDINYQDDFARYFIDEKKNIIKEIDAFFGNIKKVIELALNLSKERSSYGGGLLARQLILLAKNMKGIRQFHVKSLVVYALSKLISSEKAFLKTINYFKEQKENYYDV